MIETLGDQWPRRADWPTLDRVEPGPDDARVVLTLSVAEDSPWLEGHFPGRPVLPGVVQLRWAVDAAGLLWPALTTVSAVANLKFSAPILPPAAIDLTLIRDPAGKRLRFSFHQDGQARSQGRVTFA